jgi:hypothetical protein
MPAHYLCLHLLLTGLCVAVVLRLRSKGALALFCIPLFVIAGLGFGIERIPDWAWSSYGVNWPDLVYLCNLSLEAVAALLTLLWRNANNVRERTTRIRLTILTVVALAITFRSYAWYFQSPPANLTGEVDATGFCRQTSEDSCSAASATMLLHAQGIATTEAEMARLCLTRSDFGTRTLGLFRGVATKAQERGLTPHLASIPVGEWGRAAALPLPAIISIGQRGVASAELRRTLRRQGWVPGLRHALLLVRADPAGQWIEVADPSYGRERWPTETLIYLWDGRALVLR